MAEEVRDGRNVRMKPNILRKAHHMAIESQKTVGERVEEEIEEKKARTAREESGGQLK